MRRNDPDVAQIEPTGPLPAEPHEVIRALAPVVTPARLARIEEVRQRLGWTFPWLSSGGSDFNYDFGVSFRQEDIAAGRAIYNYGTVIKNSEDMHGVSIFAKDEDGDIFHTYSTYHRGDELLIGAFMWLDLAPRGRNETGGVMSWVKLHDAYQAAPIASR